MRKVIAAINLTIDGYCDHTAGIADDELHEHYARLLAGAGTILYGRITYQLMEYWRGVLENPTGNKPEDEFAAVIDRIPKVVFSRTLKSLTWKTAGLAHGSLEAVISELKTRPGKDILVGSPSLIAAATNLKLIDEYQLCFHPVILGSGLTLFKNLRHKTVLNLTATKTFGSGAVVHYYQSTD